jgi:hypothetical protein
MGPGEDFRITSRQLPKWQVLPATNDEEGLATQPTLADSEPLDPSETEEELDLVHGRIG